MLKKNKRKIDAKNTIFKQNRPPDNPEKYAYDFFKKSKFIVKFIHGELYEHKVLPIRVKFRL